jgi:hypothetical protein
VAGEAGSYPQRAELIAEVCGLWKAARRPPPADHPTSLLDGDGWERLDMLADRLARHLSFEYLDRRKIRDALVVAVRRYRAFPAGTRPASKELAAELLDGMAREPMRYTVYLGVRHLKLPHGTSIGGAGFICLSQDPALARSFAHFQDRAPELACEVEAVGGTEDLLRDRARVTAERALALLRQWVLAGFMAKIYLDQVMFGLDGTYTWRVDGELAGAGWWRDARPIPMDLTSAKLGDWREQLDDLAENYEALSPEVRLRVDTCIDWLDVAARSDKWRIIIPAVFSALESILVPETSAGLKAGLVTVRSTVVHAAVGEGFFDPGDVRVGYELRNNLVHGTPTSDVPDAEAARFADITRKRAFDVFRDYLRLSKNIGAQNTADIIAHLDRGPCEDICTWLEGHGGSAIVAEYRASLAAPSTTTG